MLELSKAIVSATMSRSFGLPIVRVLKRLSVLVVLFGVVLPTCLQTSNPSPAKDIGRESKHGSRVDKSELCRVARKFVEQNLRQDPDVRVVSFAKSLSDYGVESAAQDSYRVTSNYERKSSKGIIPGTFTVELQKDAHAKWELLDIQLIE